MHKKSLVAPVVSRCSQQLSSHNKLVSFAFAADGSLTIGRMRNFEVLFDEGEPSPVEDAAYSPYGRLGFPAPPASRPWIFSNLVQTLDGIVSLKGKHGSGMDISQSEEDRWLMDLLRAHADGLLLGTGTLIEEARIGRRERGPVFRIMAPELRELRRKLGRGREKNIFVTSSALIDLNAFRAFDGEHVDAVILTTRRGAERLANISREKGVRVLAAGEENVDLRLAMRLLYEEFGVHHLLCEGGPTLYGAMIRAGLIDEKFVTVSPVEVGQLIPPEQQRTEMDAPRETSLRPTTFSGVGFTKDDAPWWKWMSCRRVGDHQFNRYRRKQAS